MRKLALSVSFIIVGIALVYISLPPNIKAFVDKNIFEKDSSREIKIIKGEVSSYKTKDFLPKENAEFKSADTETIIAPTTIPPEVLSVNTHRASELPKTSSKEDFIIDAINKYRQEHGLSTVVINVETCSFAATRALEIKDSFSHEGFNSRVAAGTLPYLSYSKVTENIAEGYDYRDVVNAWIASPGHEENLRSDTPYVCVRANGSYFAFEGWKP